MFCGYKLGPTITDDNDNLHRGQRSTEVRCDKLFYMVTAFGQMNRYYKPSKMMTFLKVEGHPNVI